jgi:AraC-like DNA-binding protein
MHMAVADGNLVSVRRAGHIPMAVAHCGLSNANASVYRRLRPSAALAEYVRGYYYRESRAEPTAFPWAASVLPMLTFFLGARCRAFEYAAEQTRLLSDVIALGPCDHRVAEVTPCGHIRNFTVLFEPTGFFRLFHVSPADIRNRAYDCGDVLGGRIFDVRVRLGESRGPEAMARAVEEMLHSKAANALPKSRIQPAAQWLLRSKGKGNLMEFASSFGISDSSWRRHFTREIGFAPKRYLRMLRFQHAVALKRSNPGLAWTEVCLDAGYYDQAHLIADFHEIARASPSNFMRELGGLPEAIVGLVYRSSDDRPHAIPDRRPCLDAMRRTSLATGDEEEKNG